MRDDNGSTSKAMSDEKSAVFIQLMIETLMERSLGSLPAKCKNADRENKKDINTVPHAINETILWGSLCTLKPIRRKPANGKNGIRDISTSRSTISIGSEY
jgi:hypothetical protein